MAPIAESDVLRPDFLDRYAGMVRQGGAFTAFLCHAIDIPF